MSQDFLNALIKIRLDSNRFDKIKGTAGQYMEKYKAKNNLK